jgi:O-methyltransferase involved in polyketide biosynthesis
MNKIHLTKEKETLLITLHAKAVDSQTRNSIFHYTKAAEMLSAINYNFGKVAVPNMLCALYEYR